MSSFENRSKQVALVTGASSGIGRVTARTLSENGWAVVLVARSADSLAAAAAECPGETLVAVADVADEQAVQTAFDAAVSRFGRVDAVVHAAALVGYGRFQDIPAEVFDRVVTVNVLGTANVARVALRRFEAQGGGHLVVVGSLLGKIAVPLMSPYSTSKWAVHALVRMIRLEARNTPGVQVGLVWPGSVNTPAYYQAANYAGREGRPPPPVYRPEAVADAIVKQLDRSRRERNVGVTNHLVVAGFRFLPAVYDALVLPLARLLALSRRPLEPQPGNTQEPHSEGNAAYGVWDILGRRVR